MITLAVIAGPTASGKTGLAIDLARELGGEIINADSQQLYRGLDVGTAKPTAQERSAVPHHLLDVAEPGEGMDAKRWCDLADTAIAEVVARGRAPLVVGGTGLYLRALLHGVVDAPGRDPELRARLEQQAEREGRAALHRRLAEVDPRAAERIRSNDLVRVVRALEIAAGGTLQSELFARHQFAPHRYRARLLALDLPRAELHRRIDVRVEAMFSGGLLEEARALQRRFPQKLPPKLPLGYIEAVACVRGELALDEAVRRVQAAHRAYARRQLVWLRKDRSVTWCSPPWDLVELARLCRSAT